MEETVQREVLTREEFLECKRKTNLDIEEVVNNYLLILARDSGISFKEIVELINGENYDERRIKEKISGLNYEFNKIFNNIFQELDIRNVTVEQLLSRIPEEFREILSEVRDIFQVLEDKRDILRDGDLFYADIFIEQLQKIKLLQIKIAQELSKYDLSQIPKEDYYDFEMLEEINLGGTGAKLDLQKFKYEVNVTGSIKGCELISYFPNHYITKIKDGMHTVRRSVNPTKDDLDVTQYRIILEAYKGRTFPTELFFIFEDEEIQNDIGEFLGQNTDLDTLVNIWTRMKPDMQRKNIIVFERIKEFFKNKTGWYYYGRVFSVTSIDILNENHQFFIEIFAKDGKVDYESYINYLWTACPPGYQNAHFDEMLEQVKTRFLWSKSSKETQEAKMHKIFEKYIQNAKVVDSFELGTILGGNHPNTEMPEECYQQLIDLFEKGNITQFDLRRIWSYMGPNTQAKKIEDIMQILHKHGKSEDDIYSIWKNTKTAVQLEVYDRIMEFVHENIPEIEHKLKGEGYIVILNSLSEKRQQEVIEGDVSKFIIAIREKYNANNPDIDGDSYIEYDKEYAKILFLLEKSKILTETNINVIIDNLPRLGEEIISRIFRSNSEMLIRYGNQLIESVSTLEREDAIKVIEKFEQIFSQDTLPDFVKIYKFFELVGNRESNNILQAVTTGNRKDLSPVLSQTLSERMNKRIIFSDLMKISMDSNNKSLRRFIDRLERGNEVYIKIMQNNWEEGILTTEEQQQLGQYVKVIYALYNESGAASNDRKRDREIILSGNTCQDAKAIGERYARLGKINDLPDTILRTIIGPYQELYGGITSIAKIREYMDARIQEANERHKELAQKKVELEVGDMVKGVRDGIDLLQEIFSNGIRAGEFLGLNTHSDCTPLDTDFGVILESNTGIDLSSKIEDSAASSYGSGIKNFYVVIRHSQDKVDFTKGGELIGQNEENENSYNSRLIKYKQQDEVRRRIKNRINNTFATKRLEGFCSNVVGNTHYGIRTGVGITDIDYIVTTHWDKRIGFELAMNGTYIPVVDKKSGEIIFTPEDYDKIREQIQGLSYYGTGDFIVDKTAYSEETKDIVAELFAGEDIEKSVSIVDADKKRTAIQNLVREALTQIGIDVKYEVTGDLTSGFIEFIDTGSTGRGTNVPGDGDFDFSLKLDKLILENPASLEEFKRTLREVLAKKSNHPESSIEEPGGNFRYKKVDIDGVDIPLDIDITFMGKDQNLTYSTDMCVKERLDRLRQTNPEGYKYTIANIILAKRKLKELGIYKKEGSSGATKNGGFGGVGVENWILQNGGSFYKAMESFLEAAKNAGNNFSEFQEIYPIFDFGQNHKPYQYRHDSFIKGLTSEGFDFMREAFVELMNGMKILRNTNQNGTLISVVRDALQADAIRTEEVGQARNGECLFNEIEGVAFDEQ